MRILVTNDDGIDSRGIAALAEAMSDFGEVVVVAPDGNRSATAHSLTLDRPLRLRRIKPNWYECSGTPADCVHLALNGTMNSDPPALVASGINRGSNMGQDITYSGTVMAAYEATLLGVPSFAVSVSAREKFDYTGAAFYAKKVARYIMDNGLPKDTLLNLNVPNGPPESVKGLRVTRQGKRFYGDEIVERADPRGKSYYWIAGQEQGFDPIDGSDNVAVDEGYASLTPVRFVLTNDEMIDRLLKETW